MLIGKLISTMAIVLTTIALNAQPPKGYVTGTVLLADGSTSTGFVKDDIKNNATIQFVPEHAKKAVKYNGMEILGAEIESTKFQCIKGDFFKVICNGQLCFLQKASDAAGKLYNNGNEVTPISGTDGRPGDYFFYNASSKQLSLISKKNYDQIVAKHLGENSSAVDKAKATNGDISQLKEAVDIYNNRN